MNQLRVVDISGYAKSFVDWDRLKQNFVHCILRAGVGKTRDNFLKENVDKCNHYGISYSTYHIPDPIQGGSIKEQAVRYFNWYGVKGHKLWFDYEPNTGSRWLTLQEAELYLKTLKNLGANIGIYGGSYGLRDQLENPDWLTDYDLWISWYPDQFPETNPVVQYTHYGPFLERFGGKLPWHPVHWNMPWKKNIVLWQFTMKLKARDYFATAPDGLNSGDGNITTVEPEIWWECVKDEPPDSNAFVPQDFEDDEIDIDPYVNMTNQDMINLIFKAAEPFTSDPWNDWIVRAGMTYLAVPHENRTEPYTGPKIEDLPGLTDDEKKALLSRLK